MSRITRQYAGSPLILSGAGPVPVARPRSRSRSGTIIALPQKRVPSARMRQPLSRLQPLSSASRNRSSIRSGVMASGDTIVNAIKGKKERVGRLLQMHANQREEIKEVRAGDIVAAVGMKDVTTGDTLCDSDQVITLERMIFPEPVISQAVEPRTKTLVRTLPKANSSTANMAKPARATSSNRRALSAPAGGVTST